jgi:hypothetical protein
MTTFNEASVARTVPMSGIGTTMTDVAAALIEATEAFARIAGMGAKQQ